ncbi:MAG: hypothetical protein Q4B88_00275 [Moraxella sp.]|nr:hypothetical protein [Moraxella sp.]
MSFLKGLAVAGMAAVLSGCMTAGVIYSSVQERYTQKIAASESIIAIGKPKTPIASHPHAMVLVGQENSILVTPEPSMSIPQDLFGQIFERVDLNHLYITADTVGEERLVELDLGVNPVGVPQANKTVSFLFLKPKSALKAGERASLQTLGFGCEIKTHEAKEMLACVQSVETTFTLVKQAQNTQAMSYRLKEPLKVVFRYEATHTRPAMLLLTPLAIAYDVVTLPLTIPAAGIAIIGLMNYSGGGV